jgi:hypothetical protein
MGYGLGSYVYVYVYLFDIALDDVIRHVVDLGLCDHNAQSIKRQYLGQCYTLKDSIWDRVYCNRTCDHNAQSAIGVYIWAPRLW